MRKPFQSLRLALGAAAAGVVGLIAVAASAQNAPPVSVPIAPTRPPDCLNCRALPPIPREITNPSWVRSPTPEYPQAAMAAAVESGRVTLSCIVLPNGQLTECVVRNETPPGLGFAESALASTQRARVSPRTVDGAAERARVTFTVRYMLPPEPEPPVPVAPTPRR